MTSTPETPMMKQYLEAKRTAKDAVLLFRMGDFYELFYDDAYKASEILGLTITTRDRNKGPNAMPMAGFPHHQLDIYLAKLINAGYKAAVCEQMEDPKKAKTIVKREVIRIVTPGTVIDDSILDPKTSNYLAAVTLPAKPKLSSGPNDLALAPEQNQESDFPSPRRASVTVDPREMVGLAWVELSTGEFFAAILPFQEIYDLLARIHPSEILIPEGLARYFPDRPDSPLRTLRPDWSFGFKSAEETLHKQFKVKTLEGFEFSPAADTLAICAAGGVLDYLRETQKQSLEHIETIRKYNPGNQLEIDEASQRSLEILRNNRDGRREGSLLDAMDKTVTSMGGRMLASWIAYPQMNIDIITQRQDAVEELVTNGSLRESLRESLRSVFDLSRIVSRVVQNRVAPRDLVSIRKTLEVLPGIKAGLDSCLASLLQMLASQIYPLEELAEELRCALGDEVPFNCKEGGFIASGYDAALDEYRELRTGGKEWLARYQASESEKTGIPNLRVGFNSVFGYYIEVSQGQADKVPDRYIRKQTLKNAERYITEELKIYEEKVLRAEEDAKNREFELFEKLTAMTAAKRAELQRTAGALAHADVIAGLAEIAALRDYHRPLLAAEPILHIRDGRHPVLDAADPGNFVPNDADCSPDKAMIHLITGPNMAGKSTYIRQIALIVLMAQTGSFVPASEAVIGITDRIFARVGASDELTRGLSTFMVEMIETARILNGATRRSLVILDEIGRGTSTYDGISLAWGIAEALNHRPPILGQETKDPAESNGCRTFFATHYHELTNLPDTCTGIDNLNVAVREWDDQIAFLHKIVPGPADRSYGIHVARLAGVPKNVIRRAQAILSDLEASHIDAAREALSSVLKNAAAVPFGSPPEPRGKQKKPAVQFSLFGPEDHPVVDEIRAVDVGNLTPLEAFALITRWKEEVGEK